MKNKIKIVLVEDHAVVREGLKALLQSSSRFQVVGEADNGIAATRCISRMQPDLVLLDLSLPKKSGLEVIKEVKSNNPQIKIIVLSVHQTDEYVHASLEAGADGYTAKEATYDELEIAIRHVLRNQSYISPHIARVVINGYLGSIQTGNKDISFKDTTLTHRETEILRLIAEGGRNKNIATDLCISVKTVEKHRSNLMRKLNLHNSTALAAYAYKSGIVN